MDNKTFYDMNRELKQHSSDLLITKGNEYAPGDDRLANFKAAALIWKLIKPEIIHKKPATIACLGMKLKHFISIIDIINSETPVTIDFAKEKFGDDINYDHLLFSNLIDDGTIISVEKR